MSSNIQEKIWHPSGLARKVRGRPLLIRMQFMVPAPLEVFYEWFTDLSNYCRIFDHVLSITPLDPQQPFEVGKRYEVHAYNYRGVGERFTMGIEGIKPYRSIFIKVINHKVPTYYKFYFVGLKHGRTMFTICQYTDHKGWWQTKKMKIRLAWFYFFRKGKAAKKIRNIFSKA